MLLALLLSAAMAAAPLTGVVKDQTGGTVQGASVVVQSSAGEQQTITGPDGRFTLNVADAGQMTLIVKAGGFAEKRQNVSGTESLEIVLAPANVFENVTVTPTRNEQRIADVPASISVLDSSEIRQSPAVVADDVLKQIPTFSLFRRTSSLVAHPTAQGVSLRGIGPSGVSRTLVMLDDVPFNDPFGGWVYWTRVPLDNVDRIEVVEGPSSSIYGNYGMGGVINIVSARATRQTVEFKPQYGNRDTRKADFFGSNVWKNLGVSVNGSLLDTDGFPIVAEAERGPIDNNARVNFKNFNAKVDYAFNSRVSAFFRAGYFREERDNAKVTTFAPTVEEGNDTRWTSTATGVRILLPDSSDLQARVFTDNEEFNSNFLAVPNLIARDTARLTLNQNVPAKSVGGMVQWNRGFGARNYVSAGTDWHWVDGDSIEDGFDPIRGQTQTLHRISGGTQTSVGAYVQDILNPVDKLMITLSARVDHWRNYDGHNLETNIPAGTPGAGNMPSYPDRDDTAVSPHAAVLYHFTDRVSAWGGLSGGFRAPTLNELYRQFRVGAILTQANAELGPERLKGGELGLNLLLTNNFTVRSVWYDNRIEDPVSNVTVGPNIQRRQNLGHTRVTGIQTDAEYRLSPQWRVSGAYLFNSARVTEFDANPALVNDCRGIAGESCFLAEVPQNRGSLRVSYINPRLVNLALGMQFMGLQYDDDQNVRGVPVNGCAVQSASCANPGLPGYALVDFTASRPIGRNFEVFFGVQNLTDKEYFVQTNPTTVGSPRLVNVGVRVRFANR
jgi:outer membrane receptor protein involved in Fe transport